MRKVSYRRASQCTLRPASLKDLFRAICRDLAQKDRLCLTRVDVSIHPIALALYLSHTFTNQALIPSGSRWYHVHSDLHAEWLLRASIRARYRPRCTVFIDSSHSCIHSFVALMHARCSLVLIHYASNSFTRLFMRCILSFYVAITPHTACIHALSFGMFLLPFIYHIHGLMPPNPFPLPIIYRVEYSAPYWKIRADKLWHPTSTWLLAIWFSSYSRNAYLYQSLFFTVSDKKQGLWKVTM